MKKITLSLLLIYLTLTIEAQSLITVEHIGSASFYNQLDSALAHASNNDNIYLPGGYIASGSTLKINKLVNIYGVGYHPDSTTATGNTIIQAHVEIWPTGSGGMLTGVHMKNFNIVIHDSVNTFKISRCYLAKITIGSGLSNNPASNITISEAIATDMIKAICTPTSSPQNVLISNSYIGNLNNFHTVIGTDSNICFNNPCRKRGLCDGT